MGGRDPPHWADRVNVVARHQLNFAAFQELTGVIFVVRPTFKQGGPDAGALDRVDHLVEGDRRTGVQKQLTVVEFVNHGVGRNHV